MAKDKYLSKAGLGKVVEALRQRQFDGNKGLSECDYTQADKDKLAELDNNAPVTWTVGYDGSKWYGTAIDNEEKIKPGDRLEIDADSVCNGIEQDYPPCFEFRLSGGSTENQSLTVHRISPAYPYPVDRYDYNMLFDISGHDENGNTVNIPISICDHVVTCHFPAMGSLCASQEYPGLITPGDGLQVEYFGRLSLSDPPEALSDAELDAMFEAGIADAEAAISETETTQEP